MSEQKKKATTDLSKGVSAAGLDDGGMVLGHVGDQDVVLVRSGTSFCGWGKLHALPRAARRGLVCRRHDSVPVPHACFSLRTGEALRAPALDSDCLLARRPRGDRIFVREKMEAPSKLPRLKSPRARPRLSSSEEARRCRGP